MPYPRHHATDWFTTSDMRAINITLVTDVQLFRENGVIAGATVFQQASETHALPAMRISASDAARLWDLLF